MNELEKKGYREMEALRAICKLRSGLEGSKKTHDRSPKNKSIEGKRRERQVGEKIDWVGDKTCSHMLRQAASMCAKTAVTFHFGGLIDDRQFRWVLLSNSLKFERIVHRNREMHSIGETILVRL